MYKVNINSRFKFGKYKGLDFRYMVAHHIHYIGWCLEKGIITLSPAAKKEYNERLSRCNPMSEEDNAAMGDLIGGY